MDRISQQQRATLAGRLKTLFAAVRERRESCAVLDKLRQELELLTVEIREQQLLGIDPDDATEALIRIWGWRSGIEDAMKPVTLRKLKESTSTSHSGSALNGNGPDDNRPVSR